MADVAYNAQTGEAVRLEGDKWVPAPTAKNDKTGEVMAFDGQSWVKVGGGPPERSTGERVARGVGFGAQGLTDAAAGLLGMPVDLANMGLKAIGLGSDKPVGGSGTFRDLFDYTGRAANVVRTGSTDALSKSVRGTPETTGERIIYGASRGLGDAAGMLLGAGAVKAATAPVMIAPGISAPPSVVNRVATALTANPGTQIASGIAGGAVGEATDSPVAGLATALAVGAAPSLLKRATTPGAVNLTPEQQRLAQVASSEGIPLTTGQMTGSKPIQTLESVLGNLPVSAGMAKAQAQGQREAFNAAVLKRAGIDAKSATPDVLNAGKTALGQEFGQLANRNAVDLADPQLVNDVTRIGVKYLDKLPVTTRGIVDAYASQLTPPGGGTMTGSVYQETRSLLGRQADSFKNSDYATFRALKEIRNALDEAMMRSASPADAAKWKQVNRQYANLKTITKAMEGAGAEVAAGNISPARLRMAANQSAKGNFATGAGDLNDLARVGESFVRPQVPDSGTSQRMFWQTALTGGAGGLAATGNLPAAGVALATAPAVQRLLQSEAMQRYLTQGKPPPDQLRELVLALMGARAETLLEPPRR